MSKHNVWKKTFETLVEETSWDRPKSAPYSRLKNSKRTSKCQFTILENLEKPKNGPSGAPGPASVSPWALKRKKVSQCQKTETGTLWGFSTSILSPRGRPRRTPRKRPRRTPRERAQKNAQKEPRKNAQRKAQKDAQKSQKDARKSPEGTSFHRSTV